MAFLHFFSFFVVPLPAKPLPVLFIHSIFLLRFSTFPCTSQQSSSSFFFSFSFSPLPFNLPTLPFSPFLLSITYFFTASFRYTFLDHHFFIWSFHITSLHSTLTFLWPSNDLPSPFTFPYLAAFLPESATPLKGFRSALVPYRVPRSCQYEVVACGLFVVVSAAAWGQGAPGIRDAGN